MMFDRLLLVSCILIVAALILYFFYWNRFIAFIIGQVIRVWYWNQEASSIWVEIGSIHFSILAGRVLIKDFRYHSSNQTIKIVKGQFQWRYWIRRPTMEDEIVSARGEDEKHTTHHALSCRIHIFLQGFEWFLYNRTAAYDNIISQMDASLSRPTSRMSGTQRSSQKGGCRDSSSPFYPPSSLKRSPHIPVAIQATMNWLKLQLPNLDPKDLLPLGLEVSKGVIVLGNPSSQNLLIAEFKNAIGTFGIVSSKSKLDLYKQLLSLNFQNASIRFVINEDYVDPMTTIGELVHNRVKQNSLLEQALSYVTYRRFTKLWRQIRLYALTIKYSDTRHKQHNQSIASSARMPKKSKKAIEDETLLGANFATLEYAIERKVLETPLLELSYYVDVVGDVPEDPVSIGSETIDIGNGDTAPEWGFDLVIRGGFLRYGPWADRQRTELQRIFFPPTYQNSEITQHLKSGDKRAWTALRVFIELRDETVLRVPFREASKDWQWDGLAEVPERPRKREAASINIAVGDRSSINYVMSMVAGPDGYESAVEVHLDSVAVTSSLNDIKLVSAESCRIRGELPSPIKWNAERTWIIEIHLRQPILHLLRDHINMFTDLGKDWTSGPPTDWQKFVPTIYTVKFELYHYELNLYANDQNIIDKPLIKDDNTLVVCTGTHMTSIVTIPSNTFRPEWTDISFSIEVPNLMIDISLPRWNTHALHAPKEGYRLINAREVGMTGFYRYYAEVREDNFEQLNLNFKLSDVAFKALGWSIRCFMVLRENYLGSFTHFTTLFEYLDKRKRGIPLGDPIALKYREGKSNILQVEMALSIRRILVIMPVGLLGYTTLQCSQQQSESPSAGPSVVFSVPDLQLQFRMHDYYMEMSLNVDTVRACIDLDCPDKVSYERPKRAMEVLLIDGIDITANRLFGPQPRTATYVCIWEIRLGHVKASFSALDGKLLTEAVNVFRLNFVDSANAPANEFLLPVDPDVTFYKVSVVAVDITWRSGQAALAISCACGLRFNSNDLGAQFYRKVHSIRVPQINLKVLLATSDEHRLWLEAADLIADAFIDIYSAPSNLQQLTRAQLNFIHEQDVLTGRARRMFGNLLNTDDDSAVRQTHKGAVFLPQPMIHGRSRGQRHITLAKHQRPVENHRLISSQRLVVADVSESDGEDGMSEVSRDVRLAQTRSLTPIPLFNGEDDLAMSSGDESDNADLTDGESDSDSLELSDASNPDSNDALLAYYSHLTQHYVTNRAGLPGLWEGAPFILKKQRTSLGRSSSAEMINDTPQLSVPIFEDSDQDKDTTTFRIRLRRTVEIKVTPLVIPAFDYLELDIESIELSPELQIDSLMSSYLSGFKPFKILDSCTVFDIRIPSIAFHVLEHISISDTGHPVVRREVEGPSNLDVTAVLNIGVEGLGVMFKRLKHWTALSTNIDKLDVSLGLSVDKRTLRPVAPDTVLVDFSLCNVQLTLVDVSLEISSELIVKVGHHGPELAVVTGVALMSHSSHVSRLFRSWNVHSSARTRYITRRVIELSGNKPIIDPLSTIQPSYLVQSGTPHMLRTDTAFRFLFHLRNCLWNVDNRNDGLFPSFQPDLHSVSLEEFMSSLEARLAILDQDAYNIGHLSSLESAFPGLTSVVQPAKHPGPPMTYFSLKCPGFSIIILEPSGGSSSEFSISELLVTARVRTLEAIQFASSYPTSMSQTSLRSRGSKNIQKASIDISIGEVSLTVFPHLMQFAQHVFRVRGQYGSLGATTSYPSHEVSRTKLPNVDLALTLSHARVQAAAENLVFETGVVGLQISSSMLYTHGRGTNAMNHTIFFNELYLRARSPADFVKKSEQDVLASIAFTGGTIAGASRQELKLRVYSRLIVSADGLQLSVPRSALRLYRFVEEWRADFLPGMEAALNDVLAELRAGQSVPMSPTPSKVSRRPPVFHINAQVKHTSVSLQVMHGTWLSWEINNTIGYLQTSNTSASTYAFGMQAASMVLGISSKQHSDTSDPSPRLKLKLPCISLAGHYNGIRVHLLVIMDFIQLKVKPSHWDTLLVVQQKFGQDFNDLVGLMQETHLKKPARTKDATTMKRVQYGGFLKMRGFRIGLEGASSTLFLECSDIGGGMNNDAGWAWDIALTDLALSLSSRSTSLGKFAFIRDHRSAFVTIDFKISAKSRYTGGSPDNQVQLSIRKIHAVMQPSSISEVGDFIDDLQNEILDRKEQRTIELEAFKEKTRNILRTLDANAKDTQLETKGSWLADYTVAVSIYSVGVAFPLIHNDSLELPREGRQTSSGAVRAFLFSIKSIEFSTSRGETGEAMMKNFSFIFTSRFRQAIFSDFSSENHQTRNRLVYPEMKANLRKNNVEKTRKITMSANVSGFILDVDSTIPDYVFALVDVYRQGKDRVERLSATIPRTPATEEPSILPSKPLTTAEQHYSAIPTSNFIGSLTFLSGKVRVYSSSATARFRSRALSDSSNELSDEQILELGAEVFNLPVVSVWAEYRAISEKRKTFRSEEQSENLSMLMFKSTVYSSQNILRPDLLPFLTELVSRVEVRMRKASSAAPYETPLEMTPISSAVASRRDGTLETVSSMQISFSLRIDRSRLELTCQPDVNVIAGLHWESGGFVINVSPGARRVAFTGSVSGLQLGLKHGFLSEDCMRVDARNLAFTVSFANTDSEIGASVHTISVVLDTELHGEVRFSRLQDVLCFKAVWLDRIPVFNGPAPVENKSIPRFPLSTPTATHHSTKQALTTSLLVRVRRVKLDIDLGQNISAVSVDMNEAVLRTNLTEEQNEVSISVAELSMTATGNLSGQARVPSCVFQTIRRSEKHILDDFGRNRMLELRLTSGTLVVSLESDNQKLLHYRAEPLEVDIYDDWSMVVPKVDDAEQPLQLSFTVTSPEIMAVVMVGTIPKLLAYASKFNSTLETQRQGASRESKTFRATRSPKPNNPLSAVAEAMLHSARSRFKEADTGLSYVIRQNMTLRLEMLRLVVFPRTMDDLEIAQFIGQNVHARLDRIIATDTQPSKIDLHLSFSTMTISKYTQTTHPATSAANPWTGRDGREWLNSFLKNAVEAIIVGLPSMKMHMVSEEIFEELTTNLVYDFYSEFVRREGMKAFEDIYITLNLSLYSWLTVLRKTLTREMEQARAAEEWRAMNSPAGRKRAPEPLSLTASVDSQSQRSSTLPSPPNYSAPSPMSAKIAAMDQRRSASIDPSTTRSEFESQSPTLPQSSGSPAVVSFPTIDETLEGMSIPPLSLLPKQTPAPKIVYKPRIRHIERLTMRQLGEATPDVMHPFFMKKAGFNLEDSLPQYVNEYATTPLEEIMEVLLKLYSRQLLVRKKNE